MESNVNMQKNDGEKPSLLGMFVSPSLQFERMKTVNAVWGSFWLVTLLTGIVYIINTYAFAQSPEGILQKAELGTDLPLIWQLGTGLIIGVISAMITLFIHAAIFKVFMIFIGNDTSYKKLLTISVYGNIIATLGLLINSIIAVILGGTGQELYTSLGPIFSSSGEFIYSIMQSFEVFTIWGLVVSALGLNITAGLSKKHAGIIVGILFVLLLLFSSIPALF